MPLTLANLIPGALLLTLGVLLLSGNSAVVAMFKSLPRSKRASYVLFGIGAVWFLYHVWHLPNADFGEYRRPLFFIFTAIAIGAFVFVPDFLAVRGLATIVLLAAMPLLDAGYMEFRYPQINFYKAFVYLCIGLAIYLAAVPYRLRDFLQWLFATRERPRLIGGACLAYGALLSVVAFTF